MIDVCMCVKYLLHNLLRYIVHSVPMESEAVESVLSVNQQFDVVSDVFTQLLKKYFGLLIRKRPHLDDLVLSITAL